MIFDVQRGELAERLRRYFGLVGGINPELRSECSPVAIVEDLDRAPFRSVREATAFHTGIQAPLVAAQLSTAGLCCDDTALPPNTVNGYIRVDEVVASSGTGQELELWWGNDNLINIEPLSVPSESPFQDGLPNVARRIVPVRPWVSSLAAIPGGWRKIGSQFVAAGQPAVFTGPFGWYPQGFRERTLLVKATALNITIFAQFRGVFYPNAQPQF